MSTEALTPSSPTGTGLRAALAVAGPAALGVVLTARDVASVTEVIRLPVLWVGVAALMTPALYIAAALSGLAPSLRDVGRVTLDGLSRGGGLLLGLAPALLFLVATALSADLAHALVGVVAGLGALAGLGVLFHELCVRTDASVTARFVFMGWSAVLLGIGAQLFQLGQV